MSLITVIFKPVEPNALIADSLPLPGPFITISICFIPFSIAFFPASSAASCAAKGVDFLEPLNPLLPEDDQEIVLPEEIQTKIYSVGKENGYQDSLRDWFKLIYEVVFGDENGPRLGFFISFFGIEETKKLISEKIKNV